MNSELETKRVVLEVMSRVLQRAKENTGNDYTPKEIIQMIESEVDEQLANVRQQLQNNS